MPCEDESAASSRDLQRVFVTQRLVTGIDFKIASASVGHLDIGITANLYAPVQEQLRCRG
jgi:hypothetical protein